MADIITLLQAQRDDDLARLLRHAEVVDGCEAIEDAVAMLRAMPLITIATIDGSAHKAGAPCPEPDAVVNPNERTLHACDLPSVCHSDGCTHHCPVCGDEWRTFQGMWERQPDATEEVTTHTGRYDDNGFPIEGQADTRRLFTAGALINQGVPSDAALVDFVRAIRVLHASVSDPSTRANYCRTCTYPDGELRYFPCATLLNLERLAALLNHEETDRG